MGRVNIYLHKESNTWWTDSNLRDIELLNYLNKNGFGLGTVSSDDNGDGLNKISSAVIPDFAKLLSGFDSPKDFEKVGAKVTQEELKEILNDSTE